MNDYNALCNARLEISHTDYGKLEIAKSIITLQPTLFCRKGETVIQSNGRITYRKRNSWEYSTEETSIKDIKDVLIPFLKKLMNHKDEFINVHSHGRFEMYIDLHVVINEDKQPPATSLNLECISMLNELKCELDFNIK